MILLIRCLRIVLILLVLPAISFVGQFKVTRVVDGDDGELWPGLSIYHLFDILHFPVIISVKSLPFLQVNRNT